MRPYCYLALAAFCLSSCGESLEPGLDGPLMFVAQLDSGPWAPDTNYRLAILHPPTGSFFIQAAQRLDTVSVARLVLGGRFRGLGAYTLGDERSVASAGYYAPDGNYYLSTGTNPGRLVFTALDTVSQVIAGRFSFTATRPYDTSQRIAARGRFRLHYVFRNPVPRLPSN